MEVNTAIYLNANFVFLQRFHAGFREYSKMLTSSGKNIFCTKMFQWNFIQQLLMTKH